VMDVLRYRLDDLRRLASALLAKVGVAPARASALATHLLWFDAAGVASFGIETLPAWLERLDSGQVDPVAEGRVTMERAATAAFDGQNGLPPLVLARAAGLAAEKARELGLGLVRVDQVGPMGPAAAVAADLAIGPFAAFFLGPGPSWALALPSEEGLPAVYDTALEGGKSPGGARSSGPSPDRIVPWAHLLVPEGGWLVGAVAVTAIEPLATLQERVGAEVKRGGEGPGRLLPTSWEGRRREAREHGVPIFNAAWKKLKRWADRFEVETPAPCNP
jgi:LDH2 family malate/lactate/ureidoglycolate dehydrogenase